MVSLDSPEKNRNFADSLGAKQVLLSDPTGEAARAYGVVAREALDSATPPRAAGSSMPYWR